MANNWLAKSFGYLKNRVSSVFRHSYDVVSVAGRRKQIAANFKTEDSILDVSKRSILQADARDLIRNLSMFSWGLTTHLNFNTSFTFKVRTGNDALDRRILELMNEWQLPYNCDASKRRSFAELIRTAEACRMVDGDVGILKLANGTIQLIESDRIRNPTGVLEGDWTHGVQTNKAGVNVAYAIHSRTKNGGFEFERFVSASNLILLAYYNDNRAYQIRGITPLASSIADFRDLYETLGYCKSKVKNEQFFMMKFKTGGADAPGNYRDVAAGTERPKYEVDFGGGPSVLNLEPGDDADFMDSNSPGAQSQEFIKMMSGLALKGFGIPLSCFDEQNTHYSGSRSAKIDYETGCKVRRAALQSLLRRLTIWRLQLWLQDGSLTLPDSMSLRDVNFEWVAKGITYFDPTKEAQNSLLCIRNGLTTPQQEAAKLNTDYYDNIAETAEAKAWAKQYGVDVDFVGPEAPAATQPQEAVNQADLEQALENVLSRYMKKAA